MSTPASSSTPWYGGSNEWGNIISGGGKGLGQYFIAEADLENTKRQAKENKRKTLANLMNQSMKRNRALFKTGQEYADDLNDYKSQALQQVARGFVDALQGSTGRGY